MSENKQPNVIEDAVDTSADEVQVSEEQIAVELAIEEEVSEEQAAEQSNVKAEAEAAPVQASTEDSTADEEPTDDSPDSVDENIDDDDIKVVRMLAVGQQVDGVVKRITEFGAFIDIGVGRDGLIHVSELSVNRVGKVGDVLSESQEIKPWIKKLDRDRNRISLTLIDPEMRTIRDLKQDEIVNGTVTRILPYGAFIDIGIGRDALLHVREMSNKYVEKPEDIVTVGEELEARIVELSRRRGRVDLSLKGLRDEPEDETVVEVSNEDGELEEFDDEYEDLEVLSPMELAFKKAVEAEGGEVKVQKRSSRKKKGGRSQSIQDEIVARTLDSGHK